MSVDPLAMKFPGWSTYNYVMGNPLNLIDPDGKEAEGVTDDYKVDRRGNITLIKKTDTDYDRIIGYDSKGKEMILQLEKGIMDSHMTEQISQTKIVPSEVDNEPIEETYHYTNDLYYGASEPTQKMFEFMAKTTNVEWGIFRFGSKNNIFSHSILVTTHEDATVGLSWVKSPLFKYSDFIGHDHIHPNGSIDPSEADRKFVRGFERIMPNKNLSFRIYTNESGYTIYDSTEPEIIITPGN